MKPWHTKKWRDMRNSRIADQCEQCGSTDGPMVLQHLSHYEDLPKPPSKNTAVWDLMRERGAYPPKPTVQRPACPACGKRSLTARKRTVDWRCIACHLEFDNPVIVDVPVDSKTGGEKYALYRNERQTAFQEFKATCPSLALSSPLGSMTYLAGTSLGPGWGRAHRSMSCRHCLRLRRSVAEAMSAHSNTITQPMRA